MPGANGALRNVAGNNTWAGPITLQNNPSIGVDGATIGVDGTSQLLVSGIVQDPPAPVVPPQNPIPPANLSKVGPGTLVFTNANTYTGNTLVKVGIMNIRNATALGLTPTERQTIQVSGSSGTFSLTFGNQTTGPLNFNIPPFGGIGPTASMQNALNDLSSIGANEVQTLLVSGIAGSQFRLNFKGASTGFMNYDVSPGQLQIALNSLLGPSASVVVTGTPASGATPGNYSIFFNGGTVAGFNQPQLTSDVILGALVNHGTTKEGGVGGSVTVGLTVTPGGNTYTVTFGGTLAGLNVGDITASIISGTVGVLTSTQQQGGQGTTTVENAAALQVQGGIVVDKEGLTLTGSGPNGNGALENVSGNNSWNGPITLLANSLNPQVAIGTSVAGDTLAILQPISGGWGVTKVGPGTLDYKASNTYSGETRVNEGTLLLDYDNTAISGNSIISSKLVVGNGAALPAVVRWMFANQVTDGADIEVLADGTADLNDKIDVNGSSESINTLTITDGAFTTGITNAGNLTLSTLNMTGGTLTVNGRVNLGNGNVTAASSSVGPATIAGTGQLAMGIAPRTFTVNDGPNANTVDLIVNPSITGSATTPGGIGLTKNGAGMMVINNVSNPYPGTTLINAGGLRVNGVIGNVHLNGTTAELGGSGTVGAINQPTTGAGTVNPGNSPGTLTSQGVTWNTSNKFFVDLDSAVSHDLLSVNGSITLGNAALEGKVGNSVIAGNSITIITATGSVNGEFVGMAQGATVFVGGRRFVITYNPSSVVLTAAKEDTSIGLQQSSATSSVGQVVTFTATVSPAPPGTGQPTGDVGFSVDNGPLTFVTLVNGVAVLDLTLPAGAHTITASYAGDPNYNAAPNSAIVNHTVGTGQTITMVSPNPNPSFGGDTVTITVTVTDSPNGIFTPTGTVTLSFGSTTLGPTALNGSGQAVFVVSNFPVGSHLLTANYTSNTTDFANSSGTATQVVNPVANNTNPFFGSPPPNVTMAHFPDTELLDLNVGDFQDPHSALTVLAGIDTKALALNQLKVYTPDSNGAKAGGTRADNFKGANEKWLWSTIEKKWHVVVPLDTNGDLINDTAEVRRFGKTVATSPIVDPVLGRLPIDVWVDTSLLYAPMTPPPSSIVSISNVDDLLISPSAGPGGYVGRFIVTVTVLDTVGGSAIDSFVVNVQNAVPTIGANLLGGVNVQHGTSSAPINLLVNDTDDPLGNLNFSWQVSQDAFALDQVHNYTLDSNGTKNGGTKVNGSLGFNEKWIYSSTTNNVIVPINGKNTRINRRWHILVPVDTNNDLVADTAELRLYVSKTMAKNPLLATFDLSVWQDTSFIIDVAPPTLPPGTITFSGGQMTATSLPGFSGKFRATINVSDNFGGFATRSFVVNILNQAPVISDPVVSGTFINMSPNTTFTNNFVASDPDGDTLTSSVAPFSEAALLDLERGFSRYDSKRDNMKKANEKWIFSQQENRWYILIPNFGNGTTALYQWNRTVAESILVTATLDIAFYNDPTLLYNASSLPVVIPPGTVITVDLVNGKVHITPPNGFVGKFGFTVTVDDGWGGKASRNFLVTVA